MFNLKYSYVFILACLYVNMSLYPFSVDRGSVVLDYLLIVFT
ncbi:hypothetical protein HMPREF0973_01596 [Prevotella veroralis F0319]|uniref:Uncharacterized protein n=1 Tax=Prevotella veroralis F0319 TaxID=649761 RepID=C9MPQ5_9BACT|nr:hypothetical protein HMPREF0973_01596 [Prevotella veroralis F0319]